MDVKHLKEYPHNYGILVQYWFSVALCWLHTFGGLSLMIPGTFNHMKTIYEFLFRYPLYILPNITLQQKH